MLTRLLENLADDRQVLPAAPGSYRFNGGVPVSATTVVVALLILIIAGAVWAVAPRQVGTLVAGAIALVAVLYVGISLA